MSITEKKIIELKNSYENLPQRILTSCVFCISPLNTIVSAEASEDSQILLHKWFTDMLNEIYYFPESLGLELLPDDSYELIQCANRKPELNLNIRQIYYQIYELYLLLLNCGFHGELSNNNLVIYSFMKKIPIRRKNQPYFINNINFLSRIGLNFDLDKNSAVMTITSDKYYDAFPAWKLLAHNNFDDEKIQNYKMFDFMFCSFDKKYDYLLRKIESYFNIEPNYFDKRFESFVKKGFVYEFDRFASHNSVGFHFTCYNNITGFKVHLAANIINQLSFKLNRLIGAEKAIFNYYNLSEESQYFIRSELSNCNTCGACLKRSSKVKNFQIEHDGETREICVGSIWMVRDGCFNFKGLRHLDSAFSFIDNLLK
ncbi:MAG: hypothetical protein FWD71_20335 [Oscillospiraceae bacterium]|nr:hypothetical protein [Oscillospiraceae bacterium]